MGRDAASGTLLRLLALVARLERGPENIAERSTEPAEPYCASGLFSSTTSSALMERAILRARRRTADPPTRSFGLAVSRGRLSVGRAWLPLAMQGGWIEHIAGADCTHTAGLIVHLDVDRNALGLLA